MADDVCGISGVEPGVYYRRGSHLVTI